MRIRRAADRGVTRFDWLTSHHSFSFADYVDPEWRGWSALRVLNDDVVAPGGGFGEHSHDNMEIITYVLEGALIHTDSMGNQTRIGTGEMQCIRAGTGITHAEANGSADVPVRFLQIWIAPERDGQEPFYQRATLDDNMLNGTFRAVVTPEGRGQSLHVDQDMVLFATRLAEGRSASHTIQADRVGYLYVISGVVQVGKEVLAAGDGACLNEGGVHVKAVYAAHVLLFDLP